MRDLGRWITYAGAVAVAVALVTGAVLSDEPIVAGSLIGVALLGGVWLVIPAAQGSTPKWLTLFFILFVFSTALPTALSLAVQFVALVGAFLLWLSRSPSERRGGPMVAWAALIVLYWGLLCFHPNVPNLEVGILGMRKTTLCVTGAVAGAAIAQHLRPVVEKTIIKILAFAMLLSIAVHLFAPALELSIGRSAGEYTALFGGQARLQGVFAGPFHIALAALMLCAWAFARWNSERALATLVLLSGILGLYLSLVRTAYVALVLVIAVAIILAPRFGLVIKRFAIFALSGVLIMVCAAIVNPALLTVAESILEFSSDDRFLGRFNGYDRSIALILNSPVFGWGSGAAGDTLSSYFSTGQHTTSHNILIKVFVEGGLIGVLLWAGLILSLFIRLKKQGFGSTNSILSFTALAAMGLTTASLEALPISYLVFFFAGLAIPRRSEGMPRELQRMNQSPVAWESHRYSHPAV